MRRLRARRVIDAPASVVWSVLTDPAAWPEWGPSVRRAKLDDVELRAGTRGTVSTALGVDVPFEITTFEDGACWSWSVAGVPTTDHSVEPLGDHRCRVGFGVPWWAAPYLAVCHVALRRIDSMAVDGERV